MAEEKFETNVLRMIAASIYSSLCLQTSRELFGKSYYSLGAVEKSAVDKAAFEQMSGNFQAITPGLLATPPPANPVGFQPSTEKGAKGES